MTSAIWAIWGSATRSVQTSASGPFGGVGVDTRRGGSVGLGVAVGLGTVAVACPAGRVSHAVMRKSAAIPTASAHPGSRSTDSIVDTSRDKRWYQERTKRAVLD
jgi:hypothetical protein